MSCGLGSSAASVTMAQSPSTSVKSHSSNRMRSGDPETAYEVFRNNTTAVEVIVKDVAKGDKRRCYSSNQSHAQAKCHENAVAKLGEDNQQLVHQLNKNQTRLEMTRRGFNAIVSELKKQLDAANKRETDIQKELLSLRLENEKLKAMNETKCNLINKLRRELLNVRRVLKFVMKNIFNIPHASESFATSDPDYEDFEAELKKQFNTAKVAHLAQDLLNASGATGDTTNVSKESDSLSIKPNETS